MLEWCRHFNPISLVLRVREPAARFEEKETLPSDGMDAVIFPIFAINLYHMNYVFKVFVSKFLNHYIANFEKSELLLYNGELNMNKVQLKLDMLNQVFRSMLLPFIVTKAQIDNLKIDIPWSNLNHQPIKTQLSRLHLVLEYREFEDLEALFQNSKSKDFQPKYPSPSSDHLSPPKSLHTKRNEEIQRNRWETHQEVYQEATPQHRVPHSGCLPRNCRSPPRAKTTQILLPGIQLQVRRPP